MLRLQGLIAATFSPMTANGDLNAAAISPLTDFLLGREVSGFYVCGSTGEGPLLTSEERKTVAQCYVQAARGRAPVIVQVGHASVRESQALAAHALEIGADAISCTAPTYFKPNSVAALVDCLADIASAAPSLPLYYYHIPAVTGVSLCTRELLRQADEKLPSLAGVKFTSREIDVFQQLLEYGGGRYDIAYGYDEMLLASLAAGGRSAVGSTYNFAAPLYRGAWRAVEAGDWDTARNMQSRAIALIDLLIRYGGLPAFKTVMSFLGFDCGPARLPLVSLDAATRQRLRGELAEGGFLQDISATPVG